MKLKHFCLILALLASLSANAYDFSAKNADGVTIYYKITSSTTPYTVAVTYEDESYNSYSGNVKIPETVSYSGNTYSITSIGNGAFISCIGLTSITIPETVSFIGYCAFIGCSGLTSVAIPEGVTSIEEETFEDCTGLTSVTIPNSVSTIKSSAFSYCNALTSVDIPNSVTSIEGHAFSCCDALTSINIPEGITSIEESTFSSCISLTSVTIPNSVTSIGDWAFSRCTALTSVTIPESVTSIGDYAFEDCRDLKSIQCDATVPPTLGENVFDGVRKHNCIIIVADGSLDDYKKADQWRDFYNNPQLDDIFFSVNNDGITIYYKVTSLESNTVALISANNKYSGDINIPNSVSIKGNIYSVTSIGGSAFGNCTDLTSVTIPESVTAIGNYAFYGCTSLTSVTIPEKVTSIGNYAFGNCSALNTVNYNATNCTQMGLSSSPVFSGCTRLTMLNIGENVQKIPNYAFYGCNGVTSLQCDATVPPTLGSNVFYGVNTKACEFIVPNGSIEDYKNADQWKNFYISVNDTFAEINADGVTIYYKIISVTEPCALAVISGSTKYTGKVNIPSSVSLKGNTYSVTSIGNSAFSKCSGLTSVSIPEGVSAIGSYAFSNCTALTTVNYNATKCTQMYGSSVFSECTSLTTLNIGENVQTIPDYAFYGCSKLTSVTIPSSVTSIGVSAFSGCSGLTTVTIPEKVTSIGDNALYNCTALDTVNYNATNCTQMNGLSVF